VAYLDGALYLLLAGGNIDGDGMANGLYRLDGDGETTLVADVSGFIRDNPVAEVPDDYDTDGQPYALLPMGDAFWVTEGNSNQLLRLGLDGAVSRLADLSVGHPIPTGIAPAPGGGAYVGFFTNIPYREGAAAVVRVALPLHEGARGQPVEDLAHDRLRAVQVGGGLADGERTRVREVHQHRPRG